MSPAPPNSTEPLGLYYCSIGFIASIRMYGILSSIMQSHPRLSIAMAIGTKCDHSREQSSIVHRPWLERYASIISSEVQNKMILMGHQILSCHSPVVRSFVIFQKIILSSCNCWYDPLQMYTKFSLQLTKTQYFVQKFDLSCPNIKFSCPKTFPHFIP